VSTLATSSAALYALIPMAAMLVAAALAVVRPPGPVVRSGVLHLAAGVIFAVVAVEFLPDLVHRDAVVETGIGFVAGAAFMLLVRALGEGAPGDDAGNGDAARAAAAGVPAVLLIATAVDLAIDGLMLGIGFAAGAKQGALLTIGLAVELASLGIALAMTLGERRVPAPRVLAIVAGLALAFVASAAGCSALIALLSDRVLAVVLAFGSAALLFLVTEELLTEAHEIEETPLHTALFFVGFLALFLIEMVER
jgi:ZIP family zinc transporter